MSVLRGTNGLGMSGHSSPVRGATDSWITPKDIIDALGGAQAFYLDPCASDPQPWPCARESWTETDDGLTRVWPSGRVRVNPPYGSVCSQWLAKLSAQGNGIALIFARTETRMFFAHVWNGSSALLFIRDRLYFHRPDGSRAAGNSGAPSVLVAYGDECADVLERCAIEGAFVRNWSL